MDCLIVDLVERRLGRVSARAFEPLPVPRRALCHSVVIEWRLFEEVLESLWETHGCSRVLLLDATSGWASSHRTQRSRLAHIFFETFAILELFIVDAALLIRGPIGSSSYLSVQLDGHCLVRVAKVCDGLVLGSVVDIRSEAHSSSIEELAVTPAQRLCAECGPSNLCVAVCGPEAAIKAELLPKTAARVSVMQQALRLVDCPSFASCMLTAMDYNDRGANVHMRFFGLPKHVSSELTRAAACSRACVTAHLCLIQSFPRELVDMILLNVAACRYHSMWEP